MKLTIFTIPKPFEGHIGIIQRNAIRSWCNLVPRPDIILFGNEIGVKEVAEEFGVTHFPTVRTNSNGTPYVDAVFALAQYYATTQFVCYSNCDDIFFQNIIDMTENVPFPMNNRFLMLGERWNTDITTEVDTKDPEVEEFIRKNHTLQQFPGIDYFIFPNGMIPEMPQFLVGRAGWDNWVIYHCRKNNIPVIDASEVIPVAHQNHNYSHIKNHTGDTWKGSSESDDNLRQVKNRYIYLWELADSDYVYRWIGIDERKFSYRVVLQWIVLGSPEWMHWLIEPIFWMGHNIKWGYLQVREKIK